MDPELEDLMLKPKEEKVLEVKVRYANQLPTRKSNRSKPYEEAILDPDMPSEMELTQEEHKEDGLKMELTAGATTVTVWVPNQAKFNMIEVTNSLVDSEISKGDGK